MITAFTSENLFEVHDGTRMTGEEFFRACEENPTYARLELIDGIARMPSPSQIIHDNPLSVLVMLAKIYQGHTVGTQGVGTPTVVLDRGNVFQPDAILRLTDAVGGQSKAPLDEFIEGAPELVIEVSNTSRAFDLNQKMLAYRENGVREYLVADVRSQSFHWYDLQNDRPREIDPDGVIRSKEFPGFWIQSAAVFRDDILTAMLTLQAGLASAEHLAFVEALARRRVSISEGEN